MSQPHFPLPVLISSDSSLQNPLPLHYLFRKEKASRRSEPNRTKLRNEKSRQSVAIQLFPLIEFSQKHQANHHNVFTEDLVQTLTGPVLAISPYGNPCEH